MKKKVLNILAYKRATSSRPVSTISEMSSKSQNALKLIYRTSVTLENAHAYQVYLFEIQQRSGTPDDYTLEHKPMYQVTLRDTHERDSLYDLVLTAQVLDYLFKCDDGTKGSISYH